MTPYWRRVAPLWIVSALAGTVSGIVSTPAAYALTAHGLEQVRLTLEHWEPAIVGLGTLAIAAFTATLWRATTRLWQTTSDAANQQAFDMQSAYSVARRSADAARRSAEAAMLTAQRVPILERAYIFAGPTNIQADNDRIRVQITVGNSGRTPGIVVAVCAEFSSLPPQSPEPHYETEVKRVDFVINSSIGLNPNDPANRVVLPLAFKGNLTNPIYFWGYIDYIDIFKQPHTSRFCTELLPSLGKYRPLELRLWNDWT
jgi:hypothetical protein